MNKVILVGRLTKDPELRATQSGISVASFTVACERRFAKQGEERQADFINCIAWRQSAEAIARFFQKGHRIALEGTLQTRSWTDGGGNTRYATEVVVEQWEFARSRSETQGGTATYPATPAADDSGHDASVHGNIDGFMPIEDMDLPF